MDWVCVEYPFLINDEALTQHAINNAIVLIINVLEKFKNKKNIVVFCRSGARSGMAKSILEQNGFTNVINAGTWESVNQYVK